MDDADGKRQWRRETGEDRSFVTAFREDPSPSPRDIDQASQTAEMWITGRAVHRPNLVSQITPYLRRRAIQRFGMLEDRHVHDPPSLPLIKDRVEVGQIGASIMSGHGWNANHAISGFVALGSDRVELSLRLAR